MPKGHNRTGRSRTDGRFTSIPEIVLASPSYVHTSPVARAALIEIARLFNGSNNGRLGLSVRQAADRLGCSKDTANRAIRELQEHGFIEPAVKGYFCTKSAPRATEWRLTWKRCDRSNALATHDYRRWKAPTALENKSRSDLEDSTVRLQGQ
jgi:Homeodomain-like domain